MPRRCFKDKMELPTETAETLGRLEVIAGRPVDYSGVERYGKKRWDNILD
jgi:hypothetical protein